MPQHKDVSYPSHAVSNVSAAPVDQTNKPVRKPSGPFAVMSNDRFVLKDTNNDGIPDTVVVERDDPAVVAKALADTAKYAEYYSVIAHATRAAEQAHRGQSVNEVQAAVNIAVAKARAEYKGAVPPAHSVEAVEAEKTKAAADKAAYDAEVARLSGGS